MTKLNDLPDEWPIVVDTETSKLHPDDGGFVSVVSFAYRDPQDNSMVSKALPFDQGMNQLPLGPKSIDSRHTKRLAKWPEWATREVVPNLRPEMWHALWDTFKRKRFQVTYHNAKFDMVMINNGLRGLPGSGYDLQDLLEWDTQAAQKVREPQMPTGLKASAVRLMLTDAGNEDAEQQALNPWLGPKTGKNADPRYDLVPWSVMEPYARVDAELTLLLAELQHRELDPDEDALSLRHIYRELALTRTLYRMELRGVGFDVQSCRDDAAILRAEFDRLAEALPFKGGTGRPTPVAARKFFFDDAGRKPFKDKVTAGGQPQVDEEVIARLIKQDVPFASEYEQHEGIKSALSKWYESWPNLAGADGRLRTVHRQNGTVSGRLSVERIQLQAIPHDYLIPLAGRIRSPRKLIRPKAGHRLAEFDVSQAEIRVATAMARCQPMLDGILNGDDSHSIATKLMFGIDESDPNWDQFRQVAKRCNLGILYGAGVKAIMEQIMKFTGMTPTQKQVKTWIDDWKNAFPEFADALDSTARLAERMGFVRLYNGRERWFSDYEPSHKAFNQLVQGSLAEVMKDIMVEVDNLYPGELLLQIHDSVLLEVPASEVDARSVEVCDLMKTRFEQAFARPWGSGDVVRVPFVSDTKVWEAA